MAPFLSASIISSSVPGLLVNPSCGMTQISRSIAHLYLSISAFTPSTPRRPIFGSTSAWVRMRVAPWLMHFSMVAEARSITSSTVIVCLTADTRSMAR